SYQPVNSETFSKKWSAKEYDPIAPTDMSLVGSWVVGLPSISPADLEQIKAKLGGQIDLRMFEGLEYYTFNQDRSGSKRQRTVAREFTWKIADNQIQISGEGTSYFLAKVDGVFFRPSREMGAMPLVRIVTPGR